MISNISLTLNELQSPATTSRMQNIRYNKIKTSILMMLSFCALFSQAQSENFCYEDLNSNRICVDTTDIPNELVSAFSDKIFHWDEISNFCADNSLEILEIKRLRRNKKYRLRFINACKFKEGGITSIGGAVYIIYFEKDAKGILRMTDKIFQYGEI